jgi:hypothetical protein
MGLNHEPFIAADTHFSHNRQKFFARDYIDSNIIKNLINIRLHNSELPIYLTLLKHFFT